MKPKKAINMKACENPILRPNSFNLEFSSFSASRQLSSRWLYHKFGIFAKRGDFLIRFDVIFFTKVTLALVLLSILLTGAILNSI